MHGPTFMANPLACAVALASTKLLLSRPWQQKVKAIETQLREQLAPARRLPGIRDVRVLGAIGVVETERAADNRILAAQFVKEGIWVRPFGNIFYVMPPFVIEPDELQTLIVGFVKVTRNWVEEKI